MSVEQISAVTLAVGDMARSVDFYAKLGLKMKYGGKSSDFTSFYAGGGFLNLIREPGYKAKWWGRLIFWTADVDSLYLDIVRKGLRPQAPPRDAAWGERYFHVTDPDGHELSIAKPIT